MQNLNFISSETDKKTEQRKVKRRQRSKWKTLAVKRKKRKDAKLSIDIIKEEYEIENILNFIHKNDLKMLLIEIINNGFNYNLMEKKIIEILLNILKEKTNLVLLHLTCNKVHLISTSTIISHLPGDIRKFYKRNIVICEIEKLFSEVEGYHTHKNRNGNVLHCIDLDCSINNE